MIYARERNDAKAGDTARKGNVWTLVIPSNLNQRLQSHLFPGDCDEHGAIIMAGVARRAGGLQLLARELILARDGVDYVAGKRGYRMLTGEFVTRNIVRCRQQGLVYLAIHNHRGRDAVAFSPDDLASHARGYPSLLDITRGQPVGALVFAQNAVAGQLWISNDEQQELAHARVVGPTVRMLYPAMPSRPAERAPEYDRQARLFGDRGQELLSELTVGVVGAGGVGSLVIEYLARLGIGRFIIADPERIDITNLPRVTGATRWDARALLTRPDRPQWLQRAGRRFAAPKVKIMERIIHRANCDAQVEAIHGDFVDDQVARRFTTCDYIFLAADTMQARLVFNAMVHAYLIPGVQMGAKVPVDSATGDVGEVYSVCRPVLPTEGCLLCNGFITASGLQREAESAAERRAQRYVQDEGVVAPSVITLNATAASHAVNDFLFSVTTMTREDARTGFLKMVPRRRRIVFEAPRRDVECPQCGTSPHQGAFASGDAAPLFTRR